MEEKLDRIIELLEVLVANSKPRRIDFNQVLISHADEEAVAATVTEMISRADVDFIRYRP